MARRIVIIEDEQDIGQLIAYNLQNEGFDTGVYTSGEAGIEAAQADPPDLVLLDWMLPGLNGLEVCRRLRSDHRTEHVPIVFLTAKGEEADIVSGLQEGADDYITKPFSPRVLIARVHAVLRRQTDTEEPEEEDVVAYKSIIVDLKKHEVTCDKKRVELTHTEFQLLLTLMRRPGWVFNRDQLVNCIRGEDVFVNDRTVDVHVAGLRRKLGKSAELIETVRGVGYRFKE
ncbi:MAG TPA: response regulator [candidate division Zixibacteria bacterium]|nr:response regulator [candidate division Zixibacteria bacterium]